MMVEVAAMPGQVDGSATPSAPDRELARRAARRIGAYLEAHPRAAQDTILGELAGDDALVVPRDATVLLAQILIALSRGEGVTVLPHSAELTTQEAAGILNVSRPHLIKLLDAGEIPYRRVGTHRRIAFHALQDYKSRDDLKRRQAADELAALTEELGLY
jgi:excisionase family DNA binding protein